MPKKKEAPLDPKEQKRRFEELAREAGASASAKDFRDALKRVVEAPHGRQPAKSKQ